MNKKAFRHLFIYSNMVKQPDRSGELTRGGISPHPEFINKGRHALLRMTNTRKYIWHAFMFKLKCMVC